MALHRTRQRLARGRLAATSSARPLETSEGQPLDATVRGILEPRFGHSFANVRVHADARADRRASEMGARAFTEEGDVFFKGDAYAPRTAEGQHLLAHELTHVVQQERFGASEARELSAAHDAAEVEARAAADAVLAGGTPAMPAASSAAIARSPNDDSWLEKLKKLPFKPIFPGEAPDPRDNPQADRQREWEDSEAERRGDKYPSPLTDPKAVDPKDPHDDPLYKKDWGKPVIPELPFVPKIPWLPDPSLPPWIRPDVPWLKPSPDGDPVPGPGDYEKREDDERYA